ncbi:hypothetical protein Isop_3702 [Isosphaera pallida ATCC 43644]|uniref:Phospholipase/Carboxylesterase n=1 Tax=Isosphaera pallida (strain ATCC 43644 / DSM 9630 / IS1B) TaxID=575540 RepID=E8QZC9_ISOPI|nr:alpha/beta hydrolase [Isosphaera pallida]ADV64258.1 hypothetical protein Isop_3702 [Isosphaera pallida ATCC 43644]
MGRLLSVWLDDPSSISEIGHGRDALLSAEAGSGSQSQSSINRSLHRRLARRLPEARLTAFGAWVASWLVGGLNRERRRLIRRSVADLLAQTEAMRTPGQPWESVLSLGWAGLLGLGGPAHCFVYVPDSIWTPLHDPNVPPSNPPGLLMSFHGDGGNPRLHPALFAPLADAQRLVVVAPSHGFGFWKADGVEPALRALNLVESRFGIDPRPQRRIAVGISDGGNGLARLAVAAGQRFGGLVFLSAVMNRTILASSGFADAWRGRPVLVLQGERDWSVTPHATRRGIAHLRVAEVTLTERWWANEDHLLALVRRGEILETISEWIEGKRLTG